jgi:hypothetical protein
MRLVTIIRRALEPFDLETITVPVDVADAARGPLNQAAFPGEYPPLSARDRRDLANLDEAIYEAMCRA